MRNITDVLNRIMNAKMAGKTYCEVQSSNLLLNVLDIMKKHGYIEYKAEGEKAIIKFAKLNKCGVITPRFHIKHDNIEKYIRRFLPARDLGVIIISTNKGLMTHKEAEEKKLGGALIAYCY